jgi:hypothetical protein
MTSKVVALEMFTALVAFWILLDGASKFSGVDAQLILISGVAFSTFGTAILTVYGQFQLNKIKKTGEATHTLSNSAMGSQLQSKVETTQQIAVLSHRLAEYTKQPEAEAAAIAADLKVLQAKQEYQDHLIRQAKVDAVAAIHWTASSSESG